MCFGVTCELVSVMSFKSTLTDYFYLAYLAIIELWNCGTIRPDVARVGLGMFCIISFIAAIFLILFLCYSAWNSSLSRIALSRALSFSNSTYLLSAASASS